MNKNKILHAMNILDNPCTCMRVHAFRPNAMHALRAYVLDMLDARAPKFA